ncbi:MAG: hypothetical protein IB618_03410 [Candidatus Pacearchaeota archaeon]|nr:MAG: hypothetical protein IB618_03410 [Candidatus Pacearchaeota archaeon]
MPKKTPVNEVLRLIKQGYTDADIIRYLREQDYSPTEINDAMNQAKIKIELAETAGMETEVAPAEYAETAEEEMTPSIMSQEEVEAGPVYYAPAPAEEEAPAEAPVEEVPLTTEAGYPYSYPYAYPTEAPGAQVMPSTTEMEELAEEIINEKWQEFMRKAGDIPEFKTNVKSRLKSAEDRTKRLERAFERLQETTLLRVQEQGRDIKALSTEIGALEGAFSKILEPLTTSVKELIELSEEIKGIKPKEAAKIKKAVIKVEKALKTKARPKTKAKKAIKKKTIKKKVKKK